MILKTLFTVRKIKSYQLYCVNRKDGLWTRTRKLESIVLVVGGTMRKEEGPDLVSSVVISKCVVQDDWHWNPRKVGREIDLGRVDVLIGRTALTLL